ncbi:diguanylate cyclase [Hylemonella gracilis]|uniref:Diguanylate cyclase n=1 Tax=Hylemonella gracilis TaxID=80880 RepID=A0A4P6UM55_9BURK|nr:diguanylate cyclase [Hylemonella gracilis]QBK05664.1 diguanylate cyclase [Hylemonella gracilis]
MPMRQLRVPLFWLALGYAGLVLILAWQLKRGHDLALARASDHADHLVQTLDAQLSGGLRRVESSLHQIAQRLPRAALSREVRSSHNAEVLGLLRSYQESFPELGQFFVWDRTGRLLYGTAPPQGVAASPEPGAQTALRVLRQNTKTTILYADALDMASVSADRLAVDVYAPVRDGSGHLLGMVNATLNLAHFRRWFLDMDLPPDSLLAVFGSRTHKPLLQHPLDPGYSFGLSAGETVQRRVSAGEMGGRERYTPTLDGLPRLYAFRKLEEHPFYAVVGMSERDALEGWRGELLFIAIAVVLLAALFSFLLLRMRAIQGQRIAARRQADEASALLRDALESISVGIVIYDAQDRLVMSNQAMQDLYKEIRHLLDHPGIQFEDLMRAALASGLFPEAQGHEEAWLAERMQARRSASGLPYEQALRDGRWVQYSEHRTRSGHLVGSRIDITERKQLEAELREQASTDALTGLANRRHFMQNLESELERVRRRNTLRACVLMLDLDHFKRVNDQYGHAAGDSLLRHFADLLRDELRGTDTAGRLGGEEFAVILPGSGMEDARIWAQRLCDAVSARPLAWGARQIHATVSVGVAILSPDDGAADAALSRADAALYRAKEAGRNRVEVE